MGRIPSHLDAAKKKTAINVAQMKTTKGELAKPFDNLKATMKRPSILSKTKTLIKKLNQDRSIRQNRIKLQKGLSRLSYGIESNNRQSESSSDSHSDWLVRAVARLAGDQENRQIYQKQDVLDDRLPICKIDTSMQECRLASKLDIRPIAEQRQTAHLHLEYPNIDKMLDDFEGESRKYCVSLDVSSLSFDYQGQIQSFSNRTESGLHTCLGWYFKLRDVDQEESLMGP